MCLCVLDVLSCVVHIVALPGRCSCYPQLTDKETESWGAYVTSPNVNLCNKPYVILYQLVVLKPVWLLMQHSSSPSFPSCHIPVSLRTDRKRPGRTVVCWTKRKCSNGILSLSVVIPTSNKILLEKDAL